ncbi:hypothetical protein GCM10028827_23060 [Mucilaginibacter myungsuensis]
MSKEGYPPVSISMDPKLEIKKGSSYTLNGSEAIIPVTLKFSGSTSRAFTLKAAFVDTVNKMIADGVLPPTTVPLSVNNVTVPNTINVPIGVTSHTFNVLVSRSFLEQNFGKTLALGVKTSAPDKGNSIAAAKGSIVVTINTGEIIDPAAIHEVAFVGASKVFDVTASTANYVRGSEFITVNVPVALQGEAADMTVDAVSSPDSVTKYINSGLLANSQLYPDSRVSGLTGNLVKVNFNSTSNIAYLTFNLRISTLLGTQPASGAPTLKMPTLAFRLTNPSKFLVTTTRVSTIYVTIDNNFFRPYYGVPFLIKGAIGAVSDPIYAAYYDFGGQGVAYSDNNTKDGDGGWRAPDYVDVPGEYSPRTVVGWTGGGSEYLTYSVNIEQAGRYEMNALLGASNANGRYVVSIDNIPLVQTFITVNPGTTGTTGANFNTGAHGNQQPHLSTVNLPAGRHIIKMAFTGGDPDFRGFIFTRKS